MAADIHISLDDDYGLNIDDGAIADLNQKIAALSTKVGNLNSLTTTDKSAIVAAINEVDADIGDKTSLTTDTKTNLVAAINELDAAIGGSGGDSLQDQITALKNTIGSLGFSVVNGVLNVTYMEESE